MSGADVYLLFIPSPGQPKRKTSNGRWKPDGRLRFMADGPNGPYLTGLLRLPDGRAISIEAYPTKSALALTRKEHCPCEP
jgi:hypothetical protein